MRTAILAFFPFVLAGDISPVQLSAFTLQSQYSAAAYCPNNYAVAGQQLNCPAGNCPLVQSAAPRSTLVFSRTGQTDTTGFIAVDDLNKMIVLAFRGSASKENFLTDATFSLVESNLCQGCKLHKGFSEAWDAVASRITDNIVRATKKYPSYQLLVTGHSLGGALANIASARLLQAGLQPLLISFGAPRTGNPAFAATIQGVTYRVTHGVDPVPHIPPKSFGFAHPGDEYHIGNDRLPVSLSDVNILRAVDGAGDLAAILRFNTTDHGLYFGPISRCGKDWKTSQPKPDTEAVYINEVPV